MKLLKNLTMAAAATLLLASCSSTPSWWPFKTERKEVRVYEPPLDENLQLTFSKLTRQKPMKKSDVLSVENLERLSKAGNPNAQVALGKFYFDGVGGVKKDYKKAFKLFKASAEGNNPLGMYNVAICYDGGFGTEQSDEEALLWYNRAAEERVPEAMVKIAAVAEAKGDYLQAIKYFRILGDTDDAVYLRKAAVLLLNGFGTPETPDEPFKLLMRASKLGDTRAQLHLADCYQRGLYTEIDYDEMFSWLTVAAQNGDPEAQTKLAYCYQKGLGTIKNTDIAFSWYSKAAESDYPAGVVALADCYFEGMGIRRNVKKAIELYQKAASANDMIAQYRVGRLYRDGIGVIQSVQEAYRYYKSSADQGFPPAIVQVGKFLKNGVGIPKNEEEAFNCYAKAAAMNDTDAMTHLALCHLNGTGTPKDTKEAAKWLNTAAKHGSKEAEKLIKEYHLN